MLRLLCGGGGRREAELDAAAHILLIRLEEGGGERRAREAAVDGGGLGQLGELEDRRVDRVQRRRVLVLPHPHDRAIRLLGPRAEAEPAALLLQEGHDLALLRQRGQLLARDHRSQLLDRVAALDHRLPRPQQLERGLGLFVPAVDELYAIRSLSQQSHERLSNQPVSLKTRANL